jgi:hypothetical protein
MNYLKHYCNLIRKAENRVPPEGYTEKHHTFPKSIFGKNNRVQNIKKNNTGKKRTKQTRDNISKSKKGNKHFAFGKKWWNNGTKNKLSLECPGEGWIVGMVVKQK